MIESVLVDGREQKTNALEFRLAAVRRHPARPRAIGNSLHRPEFFRAGRRALQIPARRPRHRAGRTPATSAWRITANCRRAIISFHVIACNEDGVWNETGGVLDITVQPQFWQTCGFASRQLFCLLGIVVAVVRYHFHAKIEARSAVAQAAGSAGTERARIARDLHDQLGANLTQVALLGEMAEADKNLPGEIESHAQQISQTARDTTRALDEIVWAVNPSNDTLEGLANYACKYAQEYLALAGLRYRADVPAQLPATAIPPEVRHNVFLAFKEAVNNVVKHAHASEVWIRLRLSPENFILEIEDNGRGLGGMDPKAAQMRNGLRNMSKRMEDIGGEFTIHPARTAARWCA